MGRTRTKTVPDPMPRCCSCGSDLAWTTPDPDEPDARLGRCTRVGCGEWLAVDRLETRWIVVGRLRGPVRRLPATAAR
jgi:hypothetical protein